MPSAKSSPVALARTYHDHWREGRFESAADLLAETVEIETPMNTYAHKADFVAALAGFGSLVADVTDFIELAQGDHVVQVYDMHVTGLGRIRIAEHFAFANGKINRLRQIHDTVMLRAAGFDRQASAT
jgi:hypothetical protein